MNIDDDTWHFVTQCLDRMKDQDDIFSKAYDKLMIHPESPLIEPYYKQKDMLLTALGFIANDSFESIIWFVFECDYGREAQEAGRPGDMRIIDTYDRLKWLIELSN